MSSCFIVVDATQKKKKKKTCTFDLLCIHGPNLHWNETHSCACSKAHTH